MDCLSGYGVVISGQAFKTSGVCVWGGGGSCTLACVDFFLYTGLSFFVNFFVFLSRKSVFLSFFLSFSLCK